jgi:DNA-binding MarR family transcriptional regulator
MPKAPPASTRRRQMSQDDKRSIRSAIFNALNVEEDRSFQGAIRAFCRELMTQHGPEHPFDSLGRLERYFPVLEREGFIRCERRPSPAYMIAVCITLLAKTASEPPARHAESSPRRSREAKADMRLQILKYLGEQPGGRIDSVAVLSGELHNDDPPFTPGIIRADLRVLEKAEWIKTEAHNPRGRRLVAVILTDAGRAELNPEENDASTTPEPAPPEAPPLVETSPAPKPETPPSAQAPRPSSPLDERAAPSAVIDTLTAIRQRCDREIVELETRLTEIRNERHHVVLALDAIERLDA